MPLTFGTAAVKLAGAANEAYLQHCPVILIVDDDLGFVWWLGALLAEAGYQTLPATSCRQALSRIKRLNGSLGAAIVNPTLPGGHRLLETLGNLPCQVNTILVCDPGADVLQADARGTVLEKPRAGEAFSREAWRRRVQQALAHAPTEASTRHHKREIARN